MIDNYSKNKQKVFFIKYTVIQVLTTQRLSCSAWQCTEFGYGFTAFDPLTSYFNIFFSTLNPPTSSFAIDCRKQYPCSDREIMLSHTYCQHDFDFVLSLFKIACVKKFIFNGQLHWFGD